MDYTNQKREVLEFFDDYIAKYLLSDLRVLASLTPDANGGGACAIPQAGTTFTAVDLFGYFFDRSPELPNMGKMKLKVFLKNASFFPEFQQISDLDAFLDSLRDDVRSMMAHRYFLVQHDIAKLPNEELFVDKASKKVFNIAFFTGKVISAIEKIHQEIKDDRFVLSGIL